MDKTEVVKKVHALMSDKNNYTARLQAEEIVEKYVEQRLEAGQHETIVMKPITLWERYNHIKQQYDHNHIEDGHLTGDTPTARSEDQKRSWKNSYWRKKHGYLSNGKVVDAKVAY